MNALVQRLQESRQRSVRLTRMQESRRRANELLARHRFDVLDANEAYPRDHRSYEGGQYVDAESAVEVLAHVIDQAEDARPRELSVGALLAATLFGALVVGLAFYSYV